EAAQVIPNQQLLINVVSKRVRQLGLGHRPMVETTPRMSLTDIALKEIISGKLAYETLQESADGAAAQPVCQPLAADPVEVLAWAALLWILTLAKAQAQRRYP